MESPVFSIVMAAYNASDTIGEAIRSARQQTFPDFELLVIDDGSTDGTDRLVEEVAARDRRVLLTRQRNAGANAARNRAIAMARGRYVTFLDSDDLKLPTYLETVFAALEADPGAGIAYSDSFILDDRTRRIHRKTLIEGQGGRPFPPVEADRFMEQLIESCIIPFSATAVRTSVLRELGAFDPELAGTDDYELWLRIVAHGHRAIRVPGTLAVMRRRFGQISGDLPVMWRNLRRCYLTVAERHPVPEPIRRRALEKARELEPEIVAAERAASRRRGAARRAGEAVWGLRTSVTWVRSWHRQPPPELAAAFPELGS